jgi:hypothetical protein
MIGQLDGMMEVVFLADTVTEESDVRTRYDFPLTDKRATHDAGPAISDRGWIATQSG